VPVQIVRTGLRSVVFGLGNGQLELRFLPANADVQNGDLLVTSGLDGIFLPGFPVAKVVHIERDTSYSFARIFCMPLAGVENFSEVMILDPRPAVPCRSNWPGGRGSGGQAAGERPGRPRRNA
jgi:rod shape-determining protein MreC